MENNNTEVAPINSSKKQIAREALLNTVSNILFLFCLWLMSMLVPILSDKGFESAGVFTLALSVAAIATSIATFNISSFVASDVNNEFKDNHYFYFGLTSTTLSLVISFVMCFIYGYQGEVFWTIIFYNIFKLFDNFSIITRLIYHRHGKLLSFSWLLIIRSVISFGIFAAGLLISKSLFIAMLCLTIFAAIYFFVEFIILRRYSPDFYKTNGADYKKSLSIFYKALPVCIYGVGIAVIIAAPRMLFEHVSQDTSMLGYFGTMSSVTTLIPSAVTALLLPFIPKIKKTHLENDTKGFRTYFIGLNLAAIVLTGIAFVLVLFLGDWALNLVYGDSILQYSAIFKWLVLASGVQSIAIIFSDTTVAIRKLKHLLVAWILALALVLSLMYLLTTRLGIYGILYSYIISFGAVVLVLFVPFIILMVKPKKAEQ